MLKDLWKIKYLIRWQMALLRARHLGIYARRVGKEVYIMKNCCFEEAKKIAIGDHVVINYNTVFSTSEGITIGNHVLIGQDCLISALNHAFDSPNKPMTMQVLKKGRIVIEDDVWIGARVTILADVTIGRGSIVGAGALVTSDVPPYSVVGGVPAKKIRDRFKGEDLKVARNLDLDKYSPKNFLNFKVE